MNEQAWKEQAAQLGPFKLKVLNQENYGGEHREWHENVTLPRGASIILEIAEALYPFVQQAISAAREEPVAWLLKCSGEIDEIAWNSEPRLTDADRDYGWTEIPLYLTPITEALEKLNGYARHKRTCGYDEYPCDCGLTALRAQIFGETSDGE